MKLESRKLYSLSHIWLSQLLLLLCWANKIWNTRKMYATIAYNTLHVKLSHITEYVEIILHCSPCIPGVIIKSLNSHLKFLGNGVNF
jgi:hypothetical protein